MWIYLAFYTQKLRVILVDIGMNPYDMRIKCAKPPLCYDFSNVGRFLSLKKVKDALNVPEDRNWEDCNQGVAISFELSGDWMQSFETSLPDMLADGIPILIYTGDQDYICNWLGNQAWARAMDWPHKAEFNAAEVQDWQVYGLRALSPFIVCKIPYMVYASDQNDDT